MGDGSPHVNETMTSFQYFVFVSEQVVGLAYSFSESWAYNDMAAL